MTTSINRKTRKKVTETIKTRHFRYTKKNPKSALACLKIDRGNIEQTISLYFPPQTELKSIEMLKEKNPDLLSFRLNELKFTWRLDLKKGAVFDKNGLFVGGFDRYDLKALFFKIGDSLRVISRFEKSNKPKKGFKSESHTRNGA